MMLVLEMIEGWHPLMVPPVAEFTPLAAGTKGDEMGRLKAFNYESSTAVDVLRVVAALNER